MFTTTFYKNHNIVGTCDCSVQLQSHDSSSIIRLSGDGKATYGDAKQTSQQLTTEIRAEIMTTKSQDVVHRAPFRETLRLTHQLIDHRHRGQLRCLPWNTSLSACGTPLTLTRCYSPLKTEYQCNSNWRQQTQNVSVRRRVHQDIDSQSNFSLTTAVPTAIVETPRSSACILKKKKRGCQPMRFFGSKPSPILPTPFKLLPKYKGENQLNFLSKIIL